MALKRNGVNFSYLYIIDIILVIPQKPARLELLSPLKKEKEEMMFKLVTQVSVFEK